MSASYQIKILMKHTGAGVSNRGFILESQSLTPHDCIVLMSAELI